MGEWLRVLTNPGTLFAAIVPLDADTDLPMTTDLSDALASAMFATEGSSDQIEVPLEVDLDVGRYALIFGSGLFGATGLGYMPDNNAGVGDPETFYFDWISQEYRDRLGIAQNEKLRFFVWGDVSVSTGASSWGGVKQSFEAVGESDGTR